jgi:hypothetical protein
MCVHHISLIALMSNQLPRCPLAIMMVSLDVPASMPVPWNSSKASEGDVSPAEECPRLETLRERLALERTDRRLSAGAGRSESRLGSRGSQSLPAAMPGWPRQAHIGRSQFQRQGMLILRDRLAQRTGIRRGASAGGPDEQANRAS